MFSSSDDKAPPTYKASNLMPMVLTASSLPSLDLNSEDTSQSAQTNLSTIPVPTELCSLATLEIQSELSSTAAPSTVLSKPVALELVSLIDPPASSSDTNLQVCPPTSAPSRIPLPVPPGLSGVLSAALEISAAVSAAKDIFNVPYDVRTLSASESSHLSSTTENLRSPTPPATTPLSIAQVVNEDNPAAVISDHLQPELPLGDLSKDGSVSVVPELFNKLASEVSSLAPLSTKLSTIASPLVPLIPVMELIDEATPLLQSVERIPWSQVSILLFLQMVEPLTTHVVSPFTTELIRNAIGPKIGTDDQLEYVAEFFRSMFYFAEASTVLFWSRTSDKVGRKPVILIGLVGSSLSMMCFGISQSFWGSLVSRFLMSGLNGNDGVIKGMMVELVDTTDLARIYAFTPLANSAGASIGPFINDFLSRFNSSEKPPVSTSGQAFVEIPNIFLYLLTCSVPTILSITSFVLTSFYLKETVKSPAPISTLFKLPEVPADPENHHKDELEVIHITSALHIRPPELQDGLAIGGAVASVVAKRLPFDPTPLLSIRSLFKSPLVIIALGNFAFLSLIEITFRAIQPLFLANPTSFGGLGLTAEQSDNILSACGILNGIIQLMFFTRIHDYLGPRKSFMYGVASAVPLFLMFPVMSFFAKYVGHGILLWLAFGVQVILFIGFNLAFGAIFMYITASSPTPESVGAINGLSQMLANSLRGTAPGMTSGLFALSVEKDYLGGNLAYIVLATIAGVATMAAWFLPHKLWTRR